jgi:hypothetical protein
MSLAASVHGRPSASAVLSEVLDGPGGEPEQAARDA